MDENAIPASLDFVVLFRNGQLTMIINPKTNDSYMLNEFLGEGSYGSVFKAHSDNLNQDFAVKLMRFNTTNAVTNFTEEIAAYGYLSKAPRCNMHIVCLYDQFESSIKVDGNQIIGVVVSELMDGDLGNIPTTDDEIPIMMTSLMEGLAYIHDNRFAHRDLNPWNMLRKGKIFKIGDLGLVCAADKQHIPTCSFFGTVPFTSPYLARSWGRPSTVEEEQKEDIWGLGATFYHIIFRSSLVTGMLPEQVAKLTQSDIDDKINVNTPYPRSYPNIRTSDPGIISGKDIIYMLSKMLRVDPNERWKIHELLDYFNNHLIAAPAVPARADGIVWHKKCNQMLGELRAKDLCRLILEAFIYPYENIELEINQLLSEGCIDENYLYACYRMYHNDLNTRMAMEEQDDIVILCQDMIGDLADILMMKSYNSHHGYFIKLYSC